MGIQLWERRVRTPASAEGIEGSVPETGPQPEPVEMQKNDISRLDWEGLKARVANCTRCRLAESRTQTVFGVGNERAEWMIIGEAPGADEDRRGEPFVGRAGQLLNEMLLAIGLRRDEVYIANVVKSRPPNNREPLPDEIEACMPYLARQIELVNPKIILSVGRISAQSLLKTKTNIGALRGKRFFYDDTRIPLVVTYHPAYLLRSPAEKRKVWQDLLLARRVYRESLGGSPA
jgi:DNA polymerase